MNITIHGNVAADEKTQRYIYKVIGSLEAYVPKSSRTSVTADVTLKRVNRAHGNKYEVEVSLSAGPVKLREKDSTLNVLAALDIVRVKLARHLTH